MVGLDDLEGRLRPEEIDHFAWLLASLTVSAARATSVEQSTRVLAALEETFRDMIELVAREPAYLAAPCRTV